MNLTPVNFPSILTPIAIEYFDEITDGGVEGSWGVDETRCNRNYTVQLKVFTNSKYVGPVQLIGSLPVGLGTPYAFPLASFGATENDAGSYVQKISASRTAVTQTQSQWLLTLEYGPFDIWSLLGSSHLASGLIDPLDRAYEVYWGEPAKYRKAKPYDESGEQENGLPGAPYVNTIGDPLLDPPDTEETRPILFVVRNESIYNDAYASQYKDTVNLDEFQGFVPNTVKCRDIKGERFYDADWGWFQRVTYQFEFDYDDDAEGFSKLVLNAGYRQKVGGSGNPTTVNDPVTGAPMTDAVPLQQNGAYTPGSPPYFITFQEFPSIAFSGLNLPDDLLYVASGGQA